MQTNDLVSIIMPAFNADTTIKRAIDSVLTQTYTNLELFIIDDCSTDNTLNVIDNFTDSRIFVIKNIENLGAPKSRNRGIDRASGRFICFLDADDQWLPKKLELQVRLLKSSNTALSAHGYTLITGSGKSSDCIPPKKISYEELLKYNVISNCATMIDMSIVKEKVYFKNLRSRQDWAMSLEITRRYGPAISLQKKLCNVYIQKQSISSNKLKAIRDQWYLYYNVEKLNLVMSMKLFMTWAFLGLLKYSKLLKNKN